MKSNEPPYSPGFGVDPPLLAGRDDVLQSTLAGLRAGPRHPTFCQALVGDRGLGKTVLLNEIERRVHTELGWPVVTHQATPEANLVASLAEKLPRAASSAWQRTTRLVREMDKELSLSAGLLVVKADATLRPGARTPAQPADLLERLFRRAGEFARKRRSGILITIDEAQMVRRSPDLAALGAAIQLVTRRNQLPVALLLAGLPDLRHRFRGIGTFLERLEVRPIGYLSAESTRYALVKPAADRGVRFDDDALELLVAASDGYPYLVQLLGFHTWRAARGASLIAAAHARAGLSAADAQMSGLFQARWDQLTDLQREYLYAVARHGPGPVAVADVATALQRSTKQLSPIRQQLIEEHRLLTGPRYGEIQLVLAKFGEWVGHQPAVRARRRTR